MQEIKTHSKLSASGTHRWFECPGSVALCSIAPPKPDSVYSAEGTNAHSLMEYVLMHPPANTNYYIGKEKEHGLNFKVTNEMAEHVQEFVDKVRFLFHSLEGAELHVEKKFHLKHIHPDLFGTADVVIVQPFGEIHVVDFKYGAGVPVEVAENTQLLYYGTGAVHGEDYSKVTLHIHQPRADHKDGTWRSWTTTPQYMTEFAKTLKQKALITQKKDAALNPGEHCRWCNAAAICPKLHTKAVQVAQTDFAEVSPKLPEVKHLTDEQIVRVMEHRKLVTSWLDSVEEYALNKLMHGEKVPGLKLVKGRSRREWRDENAVVQKFGDKAFKTEVLSVSQAEKILGKQNIEGLFDSIEGSLQVAHDSDKRKAITNAKDDFQVQFTEDDF